MAQPWEVDWSKQGADKADAAPWERDWNALPVKKPAATDGQMVSGFKRAFQEVPGMLAGVGAYAADVFGADSARDSMLGYAKRKQDEVGAAHANDAQSITDAWDGKAGWLDFLANSAGYVAGQALQSIATGGLGALGAKMVAKQGAKELAEAAAAKAIAAGASEQVAQKAASDALVGSINKAMTRGGIAGAMAHNFGMELGSIYPDAVEQSEKDGKGGALDGGDKFRVLAAASLAAGVDTAGEAIMASRMFKGSGSGAKTMLGRAAKEVPAGMAREAGTEAIQTGIEQYGAAKPYNLKEIVDSAGVGAVGGALGGAVSSRKAHEAPKKDAGDVLAAPSVDDAIGNAMLAIAGPVSKPAWEVVDGLALPGPVQPAAPTMLRSLPAPDGQTVYMADERGNVAPQPAEARTEALNRQFDAGQQADAARRAENELNSTLGITPGLRAAQQQRAQRDAEGNVIPVGEATELPNIATGEAIPLEAIPAGEVSELIPTGEATELPKRIPVGKATELAVEVIEPGDLMAKDGEPFVSKTGAQARAFSTGGRLVSIPDHFGDGKPGYVVRPITEGRPNNTRGTNAGDLPKARNDNQPDVPGTAGQPAANGAGRPDDAVGGGLVAGRVADDTRGQQPGTAGAVAPSSSTNAPAGTGNATDKTLTPGQRVTLPNKDGTPEPWTVDGQTGNVLRLDNGKGRMRAVQVGSPTWGAIKIEDSQNSAATALFPKGGAAPAQTTNINGGSVTAAGKPVAATSQPTPQANAKPSTEPQGTQAPAPAATPAEPTAAAAGPTSVEADGLKGRKTLQEARANVALDKLVRENGEQMTRRQWVERKVAEGLKTKVTQEDRIKPMSRMAYFRADNKEQQAHDRRIKEAGKKDVFLIGDYEVTKIEHDYANALMAGKAADPAAAPPAPTGNADKPGPAPLETGGLKQKAETEYTNTLAETERRAQLHGREKTAEDIRARLASGVLARDFGESADAYYARNPVLGARTRAYKDWLAGKRPTPNTAPLATDQPLAQGATDAPQGVGASRPTPAALTPTPPPKRTAARGKGRHPNTVMGSRILAMVSHRLGGLDPAWIAQFSHRQATKAKDKNGMPRIQWRNPLIPGVGKLFRSGGTQDTQLLAEMLEQAGYLPPGSVEADSKEAGETAMQIVRDALNRAEAQTQDELIAEQEAANEAERLHYYEEQAAKLNRETDEERDAADNAYYAALDAESAQDAEFDRLAILEDNDIDRARMDAMSDDDIQYLASSEGMRALGLFTDEEIQDAERQERQALQQAGTGAEAGKDGPQAAAAPDAARTPAPKPAGQAEGLTLTAQTAEDLKAKTEREAAAEQAARAKKDAEQARLRKEAEALDLKARADQTVNDFQLGQSADQQMSGMDDMFADAGKADTSAEPVQKTAKSEQVAPAAKANPQTQTFDQWARAAYAANEYAARYLEEFEGNENRAILGAAAHTIDNDRTTAELLKAAKQEYRSKLFSLPREASIDLSVWDSLDPSSQIEAQRHFYDLDGRIVKRDQAQYAEKAKAEAVKKAPYEAAFAEVDAEIRRLDAIPGPETQKQKDLSGRRERLREALYQIGQGKEPDGRLLRKEAPAEAPEPAQQAAAILDAAAEPPKGAERLSVIKDVKAGAITPDEVKAAYPPAETQEKTDAQRQQAADHAKDLGGRVVWQSGDLALIEGYSLLSGDSVYIAANGSQRTRVDIQSYTGKGYTEAQKAELMKARASATRAADELLANNPDGPFADAPLVFSDDIPAAAQGVVRGWIGLLGLDSARIVVTTPTSGAAMADGMAGKFRRIGKASLSGDNSNGAMQPLGGDDFHIAVRPGVSTLKALEVMAHELGHIVERRAFAQADAGTQQAIRNAHAAWLKENGSGRALDMAQAMRAYRSGQTTGFSEDAKAMEAGAYWRSFGEWFADQVSRWATTQDRPVGVVEQFFKRLADRLRVFFTGERAKFKPNATVAQWLDSLAKDVPPSDEVKAAYPAKDDAKPADKIGDFGQKLEGARKDFAVKMKEAMDADVRTATLSEAWPEPNYAKLIEGGADPFAVGWMRASRDEIPTKPQMAWKLGRWVESVTLLRQISQDLMSGAISTKILKIKLHGEFATLRDKVGGRAELYEALGHEQSLKGIEVSSGSYSMRNGVTYNPSKTFWTVERKAKGGAFGNWPRELAVGETRQEVIDQFIDKVKGGEKLADSAKGTEFVIWRENGKYHVGKKIGKDYASLKRFDGVAEARKYKAENQAELEAALARYKDTPFERRTENLPRVGEDHRGGARMTPEVFGDTFGFRGVQFGNYVEQGKRQADLNDAYDALMDLAAVIGVPPKALSLGGQLGLAFGARGKGGINAAAAHYESGTVVINLTKESGAGSLAHELLHAIDNYFAKLGGGRGGMMTMGASNPAVRPEMVAAFKRVTAATQQPGMKARSRELDKRRSKPYWSTGDEMAARSFEAYVIAKLRDQGAANDYLANIVSPEVWDASEALLGHGDEKTYPYPTQEEMGAIREAFDGFFDAVQAREDDAGNLSLHEPDAPAYTGGYETDLFGNQLPAAPGNRRAAKPAGARVSRDAQPEPGVPGALSDPPAPAGDYHTNTTVGVAATRALGARVIKTAADAAAATRYLYRSAVERMDGIVTDKDGKPLAVIGGFKGALAQASVYPATLMGEAVRVPGAAFVWFSHNHPSGSPELSRADMMLSESLADVFRGSGIEPRGLLAIGNGKFQFVDESGHAVGTSDDIPTNRATTLVPAIERELAPGGKPLAVIDSPQNAMRAGADHYKAAGNKPGLLLLNSQHGIVAWVPLPDGTKGALRGTGGLNAIYRAVSQANAGAAIIVHGGELGIRGNLPDRLTPAENIAAALQKVDARPLDIIDIATNESAAQQGLGIARGPVYSKSAQPTRQRVDLEATDAVGREFWRKIDNGESFTDQEVLDALATNRRGTVREARALQDFANFGGTGEAAIGWQGNLAGFGSYSSRATWDGDHFSVFFIPDSIAANADLSDLAQARDRALVHAAFTPAGEGRYLLSLNDPKSGSTAERAAVDAKVAATVGLDDNPYTRIDLAAGDVASRTVLQEAVRRLALNIGYTPAIKYEGRDTGARAGQPDSGRGKMAGDVRNKFSRAKGEEFAAITEPQARAAVAATFGDKTARALLDAGLIEFVTGRDFNGATYADGRIQINLDAVTQDTIGGVLQHEAFHAAVRDWLGADTYAALMDRMGNLRKLAAKPGAMNTWFDTANAAIPEDTKPEHLNEELAAYAIEAAARNPQPGMIGKWVQDFLSALRTAIIRHMPGGKIKAWALLNVQPQDLARMAVQAMQARGAAVRSEARGELAYSQKQNPAWYSELTRQLQKLPMNAGPSSAWQSWLNGLASKGVKPDEVEWSGLPDWLAMQPGKVTKAQVAEYLDANGVRVQEVVLDDGSEQPRFIVSDIWGNKSEPFGTEQEAQARAESDFQEYLSMLDADAMDAAKDAGVAAVIQVEKTDPEPSGAAETKYGQYTLPGGTNYREVLLTLPGGEKIGSYAKWLAKRLGVTESEAEERPEYDDDFLHKRFLADQSTDGKGYKSGHWDQPNVLAHIRVNDRVDADGNRVLFVEEVQSDWGQAGKKNGFDTAQSKAERAALESEADALRGESNEIQRTPYVQQSVDQGRRLHVIQMRLADIRETAPIPTKIPAAPFVGKTDAWVGLALKRIVKMAVDGGYDKVAFVTGEQSADRYDLSKQISRVEYTDRGVLIATDINGREALRQEVAENKIEDYIGKEAARKLLEAKLVRDPSRGDINAKTRRIEGDGLKVGGEGMKAFYDKIVPAAAKDVLRKLSGGDMETVDIRPHDPNELGRLVQPGFAITDAMREKAAGGMPLFSKKQDVRYSRTTSASAAGDMAQALRGLKDAKLPADYIVNDFIESHGKLSWWHKTVGSMHNLAQRNPLFKPVYDAAQNFLNDVSSFATEAADMAPTLLPKLEGLRDIGKSPLSAQDTKAISAPIFQGTLSWTRDENGQPAPESDPQKAGIVWTDAELRDRFKLDDKQRGLYHEFRKAVDKSLTDLAISDMIRFGGKDVEAVAQQARDSGDVAKARDILTGHLASEAEMDPARADVLFDTGATIGSKAGHAQEMMRKGYAPLTRFGHYTLDVVQNGQRVYFGLFESQAEANRFARKLQADYPKATFSQGTMSDEAYKMFSGVSPETLEIFGEMLGLESQANDAGSQAFQEYLKLTKSNRSAMKRLIERKGMAGFSEDAGRVLAGFVYSNARQASKNLHTGTMAASVQAVADQKGQGELLDTAVKLHQYITNPQEEAPVLKGLLFAQFLGGSIAAGMVNLTQPVMVTFPYLSQHGGVAKAAGQMRGAMADAVKWASGKGTGNAGLDAALKRAEEEGIVAPQEVHALMAQARGAGALKAGDGTALGNTMAKGSNFLSKLTLLWGRPFALAEQYNRQVTFIAAFRTAAEQGMDNPAAFAEKAVNETQFTYTKANRPQWARGAIGSTLFTFKTYSISYVELLSRMAASGPEGRKAALLGLGTLFLMSGLQGLPGADDLDDLIDGLLQRLGYNFSSKMAKREFFAKIVGEGGAAFLMKGASGLPGAPIDVAGRLGLGNLIPGTGLFTKKADHTQDVAELFGAAGSFATQGFKATDKLTQGNVGGAVSAILPVAAQNAVKAADMASTGMYRDQAGRKVIDTDGYDAMVKAIGFQPNDVAKVQQASREVQGLIGLNKMRETEIADKWARGVFEKDAGMVQDARQDLADWNRQNPESPIKVNAAQLLKRLKAMREDKITRIEHTAPKEIKATVRREIEAAL